MELRSEIEYGAYVGQVSKVMTMTTCLTITQFQGVGWKSTYHVTW